MRKSILAALFFICSTVQFAQGEGAMSFLAVHPSAFYYASGHIGVTDPLNDPYGFYFNPAAVARTNSSFQLTIFHDPKNGMFNNSSLSYGNSGLTIKKNFTKSNLALPLTFGASLIHAKFYYNRTGFNPNHVLYISEDDGFDSYLMLSLGVGYEYFAKFHLGFAYKNATTDLGKYTIDNKVRHLKDDLPTYSLGLLVDIPFTEFIKPTMKVDLDEFSTIYPTLDLSIGVSLLDYAGEVNLGFDEQQIDPINRTSKIGYTIKLGYEIDYGSDKISLLDYFFNVEASDVLINRQYNSTDPLEYEAMYSDLQPLKNLFALEGNSGIIVHKAHLFSLLETIVIGYDSQTGKGISFVDVHGLLIKSDGLFKLLNKLTNNKAVNFITKNFWV
jgi:hypothetical protein